MKRKLIISCVIVVIVSICAFKATEYHKTKAEKLEAESALFAAEPPLKSYTELYLFMMQENYVGLPSLDSLCFYTGNDIATYRADITNCEEKHLPPSGTKLYQDLYEMRIKANPKYNEWKGKFPELYTGLGFVLE